MGKEDDRIEIRSIGEPPAVSEGGRTISGYALRFDMESRVLCDWCVDECFVEMIAHGAIGPALIGRCDVKALYNHNRERLLARSVNGTGTLMLSVDESGLHYEFEAPNTADGDMLLEQIRRGDICGSSFAFACHEGSTEYSRRADGMLLRVIKRIDELYDVSPVIDPAYIQTSVQARSWGDAIPAGLAGKVPGKTENALCLDNKRQIINILTKNG